MFSSTLRHENGWGVALTCQQCGFEGNPVFLGWTPSRAIHFGNTATIFANLSCPQCSANLRNAAALKLPELFAGIPIPKANKRITAYFLLGIGVLLSVRFWLLRVYPGSQWPNAIPFLALGPVILTFTWSVHKLRHRCACGTPNYLFMGLLGRSYCYRCSTCGNLLRLRD